MLAPERGEVNEEFACFENGPPSAHRRFWVAHAVGTGHAGEDRAVAWHGPAQVESD
jgi:hypothetical protein